MKKPAWPCASLSLNVFGLLSLSQHLNVFNSGPAQPLMTHVLIASAGREVVLQTQNQHQQVIFQSNFAVKFGTKIVQIVSMFK